MREALVAFLCYQFICKLLCKCQSKDIVHRGLIKSLTLHTGAAAVTSNHEFQITIPDHSMINLNYNNLDRNIRPSQRSAEILIIYQMSRPENALLSALTLSSPQKLLCS